MHLLMNLMKYQALYNIYVYTFTYLYHGKCNYSWELDKESKRLISKVEIC